MNKWVWIATPLGVWALDAGVKWLVRSVERWPDSRLKRFLLFGQCIESSDGSKPKRPAALLERK